MNGDAAVNAQFFNTFLLPTIYALGVVALIWFGERWLKMRRMPKDYLSWQPVLEADCDRVNRAGRELWQAIHALEARRAEVPPELHDIIDDSLRWARVSEELGARKMYEQTGIQPRLLFGGPTDVPPMPMIQPPPPMPTFEELVFAPAEEEEEPMPNNLVQMPGSTRMRVGGRLVRVGGER